MATGVVAAVQEIYKAVSEIAEPLNGMAMIAGMLLTFAPEVLSEDQVLVPAVLVAEILTRMRESNNKL